MEARFYAHVERVTSINRSVSLSAFTGDGKELHLAMHLSKHVYDGIPPRLHEVEAAVMRTRNVNNFHLQGSFRVSLGSQDK